MKCLSDLHTVHSRAVLFGSYSPILAQKVWAHTSPLPVVAFLHLILRTAGEEGEGPQLKVSLSEAGEPIWL